MKQLFIFSSIYDFNMELQNYFNVIAELDKKK